MKSERLIAFEVLYDVFANEAYSNLALDKALKSCQNVNKGFITTLVNGVIERQLTLEYLISEYVESKPKLKVRVILLMGAYQLVFMDRVPASAAVNESLKLADSVGCGYYKKLINAVLHKISEKNTDINSVDDLKVRYSVPESLINMWKKQYGEDKTLGILDCVNTKAPVYAVPNPLYVDADELQYELFDECVKCECENSLVRINGPIDVSDSLAYKRGLYHIEDLSSYQCACSLDVKEGETVLDVCSAPGGKAFTMAGIMKNTGKIYCFDLHQSRVELIKTGAERLGYNNIIAEVRDASKYCNSTPKADKILCDVPCSGFGIIRRKPEIRYKELDSINELPELQLKILETSARYLKDGGRLVYSTCTLNKKENEKVVSAFIKNNNDCKLMYERTVFPCVNGGDGFYYAVIEKNND